MGTEKRERSVKQLIRRVADTISEWGRDMGYFASDEDAEIFHMELTHLLVHQKMAFNSPVWFNVGIEPRPQCSACFINSVSDSMESILDLAKTKACSSSTARERAPTFPPCVPRARNFRAAAPPPARSPL